MKEFEMVSTRDYKVGDTFFIEGKKFIVTRVEGRKIYHKEIK